MTSEKTTTTEVMATVKIVVCRRLRRNVSSRRRAS
jgi:hypothetical protein